MNLADCPLGVPVNISSLSGGASERLRYAELGLMPGAQVTAMLSGFGHRRVIQFGAQRIGIAPLAAQRVCVELLDPSAGEAHK